MPYLKMLAQVFATVLAAVIAALTGDQTITPDEWINIAVLGVGAAMVFAAPNVPGAPITKAALSVLAGVLAVATSAITDGITMTEWLQIGMAALGALGVYAIPNSGASAVVERHRA